MTEVLFYLTTFLLQTVTVLFIARFLLQACRVPATLPQPEPNNRIRCLKYGGDLDKTQPTAIRQGHYFSLRNRQMIE